MEKEEATSQATSPPAAAAFWKSYRDRYTTEEDIARVAELGFNSVRVAMNARLLLPEGQDQFDESQFVYLKKLVEWGAKHKVYVIFDMHCAPGGETGKNIDDSPNDQPELFQKPENQDRLVKLWTEMVRKCSRWRILRVCKVFSILEIAISGTLLFDEEEYT